MPISIEDISNAAQALQESRDWDAPLAFSQVLGVTRHSLLCIDEALSDQVAGDASYGSAHEIVLEWLPSAYNNEAWRREAVVDCETAMAVHESLKVALIACTIEEAKTRAERLLPLMKIPTNQEVAHAKAGAP